MIYVFAFYVVKAILKSFFLLKVYGRENVPAGSGYIVACNHVSFLDPPVVGVALPIGARFVARSDLFTFNRFFGWLIDKLGAIPVHRDKADMRGLRIVLKELRKGRPLIMFPEGTRSLDGSLKEGHAGVGLLALRADVPVVPVFIEGVENLWPRHRKLPRPGKIRVWLGEKVEPRNLALSGNPKRDYQTVTDEVMKRIAGLREKRLKQIS